MNIDVALAAAGGVATILGSAYAARRASRSSVEAAHITADAEAYTRAQEIYQGGIAELNDRLAEHKNELQDVRAELAGVKAANERQAGEIQTLRTSVVRYEGRVDQLEATLRHHQIPVPAWASLNSPTDQGVDPNKPPSSESR